MTEHEQETRCQHCGLPLEPGKPCPNCLLNMVSQPTEVIEADLGEVGEFRSTASPSEISGTPTEQMPPEPDIEAIRRAFPQLEVIEKIGSGGMGTVFKARQPKLERFVALKILSGKLARKPSFAERFAQEGKLLARLSHPNIVTVYDYGEADGFFYLILEYVDGVNLREAMRERRFSPEQALAVVPKICEALQYAHEEGVLHRDIKPENILIDLKSRIKIADFGIGKLVQRPGMGGENEEPSSAANEHLTATGTILGTPNYISPEQLDAPEHVDHRADIYSLGVVFYELLTGELPKGKFPVPSATTPVNANVDEIVLKALEREKEKRFQTAGEMKTAIETGIVAANKPTEQPKSEDFPFFHDMLEFVAAIYSKSKVGVTLVLFTCLFLSFVALLSGVPLFRFMAIGAISGFGATFISQYLIFRIRRKHAAKATEQPLADVAKTAEVTKKPPFWQRIRNEVKTWPLWATIIVGMLVLYIGIPVVLVALYLIIALLIFLFGDLFETIFLGYPFISHWEVSWTIFLIGFILSFYITLRIKRKKADKSQTTDSENLTPTNSALPLSILEKKALVSGTCMVIFALLSCLVPFFVVHMGIFDGYIKDTEKTLVSIMDRSISRLRVVGNDLEHIRLKLAEMEPSAEKDELERKYDEALTKKDELEQEHHEILKQYNQAYENKQAFIHRFGWVSGIGFGLFAMYGGVVNLWLIWRRKFAVDFRVAVFAVLFPLSALLWYGLAWLLVDYYRLGGSMDLYFITNPNYYTMSGIFTLAGLTVAVLGLMALAAWLIHGRVYPMVTSEAENRPFPAAVLAATVVCIIALFVSEFVAPEFHFAKWIHEGRVREAAERGGGFENRIEHERDFLASSLKQHEQPAVEIARIRIAHYEHWLGKLEGLRAEETAQLERWRLENQIGSVIKTAAVPGLACIALLCFGTYAFARLMRGNLQGPIRLAIVFALAVFFLPMASQYFALTLWTGNPGYWDDMNSAEVTIIMTALTILIYLPILFVFFRRSISLSRAVPGEPLPPVRGRLAFGIVLGTILASLGAFAFLGMAFNTAEYKSHYEKVGRMIFLKDNIDLRNEFVASSIRLQDEKIAELEKMLGRSSTPARWGGGIFVIVTSDDGTIVNQAEQPWDASLKFWEKERRFSNENQQLLGGWHERLQFYDDFDDRFRMDDFVKIVIALFGLSFLVAALPCSVGTLLGVGYLLKGRRDNLENGRVCATAAVGLLPGEAILLLVVGLIGWATLPRYIGDGCGLFAGAALIYLVIAGIVIGFTVLLWKTGGKFSDGRNRNDE